MNKNSLNELHQKACLAREKSHSPYSHCKVGAALKLKTGQIYAGCNVENASYGGTVCAERVAIWKAVSEQGSLEITEMVVVTDATDPWPPCGMCLQVLAEFSKPTTTIHLGNLQQIQKSFSFQQLLPQAFDSAFLIHPK